ncbi:unnamed protein product [Aureobasidium pullulans]|nr:unnamed protein product [Aureobasidium pullulans]
MLSEPSSPIVYVNAQEPLLNEIERLKEQYNRLEEDFAYYEESNGGLQVQVDNQASDIDAKDREISYLKELVDRTVRDHEKAHEEAEFLRRRSSVLEITVKANAKELNGLYEVEQLLTAREAEARLFAAELLEVKTDRDDKLAEVKGLEGDLERQQLVLDAKDREIDSLYERIDIFERHISITKDLAVDELDDCLYDFVEKVTAIEGDVVKPSPPPLLARKRNASPSPVASTSQMNSTPLAMAKKSMSLEMTKDQIRAVYSPTTLFEAGREGPSRLWQCQRCSTWRSNRRSRTRLLLLGRR